MANVIDTLIIRLGLDPSGVRRGLGEARRDADQADRHFDRLGTKWGRGLMSVATRVAAPIMGAFSIGKMITSYTSSVAQVAQMTGRYSSQLEEWRLKRAALSRVTKEDIDLYIKVRKALTSFNIAMADLSAKIVRLFAPAVKLATDWLNKLSGWVNSNGHNIVRFLTVVAGILSVLLIPSIIRMGRALLTNPLTWIIVLLGLLAVAIDDLIVYMRGGQSQFAAFWRLFGTGEEISKALADVWEWLTTTGRTLLPYVLKIAAAFAGWQILRTVGRLGVQAVSAIAAGVTRLFALVRAHPFMLLLTAIWLWYENWDEICEGAKALWGDLCDLVTSAWRTAVDFVVELIERIAEIWDAAVSAVKTGLNLLQTAFNIVIKAIGDAWDSMLGAVADKVAAVAGQISGAIQAGKEFLGLATSEDERQAMANDRSGYSADFEAQKAAILANRRAREAGAATRATTAGAVPINTGTATVRGGTESTNTVNNNQVITVNGAGDPNAVAERVYALEQGGNPYTIPADSGVIQ